MLLACLQRRSDIYPNFTLSFAPFADRYAVFCSQSPFDTFRAGFVEVNATLRFFRARGGAAGARRAGLSVGERLKLRRNWLPLTVLSTLQGRTCKEAFRSMKFDLPSVFPS